MKHFGTKNAMTFMATLLPVLALFFTPSVGLAQNTSLEISGWVPYWRSEKGVISILPNIDYFTEINPFIYTVKENGTLNQASDIRNNEWQYLALQAKAKNIRFIPTITWGGGADTLHNILSDPKKRGEHIRAIASDVYVYGYDGIDIDYEGKYAKTRPFFSLFLKDLHSAIGYDKWIICTIEARTPLTSRYMSVGSIPNDIEYSNDFKEINKYCDRVRIMAYDQGRFDLKLNSENETPYAPVADVKWVEKVMLLAMEEIDKDKLIIGIPTYGYEYDMFNNDRGATQYSKLWSFNPTYATDIAKRLNLEIKRSGSGEAQITFLASDSLESVPLPNATRVVVWSDAEAIRQKVELAKKLGVRGVALFKIDGGEDKGLWSVLSANVSNVVKTRNKTPDLALSKEELNQTGVPADLQSSNITSKTPSLASVPDMDLEKNNINEGVRVLQKILNQLSFTVASTGPGSPGNETNVFGDLTASALARFQKANNITPAIGYFGPITRKAMQKL
jgi:spore germination protein